MPNAPLVSPWISIWTQPRATIRSIVATGSTRFFPILATIYGFPALIYLAQVWALGDFYSPWAVLLVSMILAPFLGYINIWIWSKFLLWTGDWIQGAGDEKAIRSAVAWTVVPHIGNICVWFLLAALMWPLIFSMGAVARDIAIYAMVGMGLQLVFSVWSLVIFVAALAEVQKISVLRAVANIVLAFMLLMGSLWVINVVARWLIDNF